MNGGELDRYLKIVYLTEAGEARDAQAELEAAMRRWRGVGCEQDTTAARETLDRIHRRSRGVSAYCYAYIHAEGIGVERDRQAAEGFYRKSAEIFAKEADSGVSASINNLGYLTAHGKGVEKDQAKAFELFRRAAEAGFGSALYNLGLCYANGIGVERDDDKAMEMFRKAAEAGENSAWGCIAFMHQEGRAVPRDPQASIEALRKAAEHGDVKSWSQLGYAHSVGYGVPVDVDEGKRWFGLAAEEGDAYAQANIGFDLCFDYSERSFEKGWQMLEWARQLGNANALSYMAKILIFGAPAKAPDYEAGFRLAEAGAAQGNASCLYLMGYLCENGLNVPKQPDVAANWYRKAVETNTEPYAAAALGRLYRDGRGIEKSVVDAYAYLRLAEPTRLTEASKDLVKLRSKMTGDQIKAGEKRLASIKAKLEAPFQLRMGN
jgi:TPR repeat protein